MSLMLCSIKLVCIFRFCNLLVSTKDFPKGGEKPKSVFHKEYALGHSVDCFCA